MRTVFVLTQLEMTGEGESAALVARNFGVTFDAAEADAWRNAQLENDFQEFPVVDIQQDEEMSEFQAEIIKLAEHVRTLNMDAEAQAIVQRNINHENLRR